jgi:hypothetical protein
LLDNILYFGAIAVSEAQWDRRYCSERKSGRKQPSGQYSLFQGSLGRSADPKGSRQNKLVILGVEAPGRQGGKSQEYLDIPISCAGSRTGCIGVQNDTLFLSEP